MSSSTEHHVKVSHQEYSALMDIRGLPDDAHTIVMTAGPALDGGWQLKGNRSAFQDLLYTVIEDIEVGIAPRKNQPALVKLCRRLTTANNPYELKRKLS
jgi:hypothetical protein